MVRRGCGRSRDCGLPLGDPYAETSYPHPSWRDHPGGGAGTLEALKLSVNQLARSLAIDTTRLNEIVRGRRGITADTALRLARYLGTSPEFWLKLQVHYELRVARQAK